MTDYDSDTEDSIDYRDEETLRQLYVKDGMTLDEIAEKAGVAQTTIRRWMVRNGIDRRGGGPGVVPWATYDTDTMGYERWKVRDGENHTVVRVHQLLAIAKGTEANTIFGGDTHVHHRNGVPWDNRPENIQVTTNSEHISKHNTGEDNNYSKLSESDVRQIKSRLRGGEGIRSIAQDYPVRKAAISKIKTGRSWTHIE